MARDLTALFDPRSVAVVGASDDPAKYGHAVAAQALRAPGRRPVHLVNRRGGTVLGRPAATSLPQLGEPVDLVVVSVPGPGFEAAVDDALACGARAIVAITAGFAETGPAGLARQRAVADRVRAAGAVLVGPNCLGIADNTTELYLASDAFAPGGVALLSQSGNLALELQLRCLPHGVGFSRFVSLGNQADVTLVDLVEDCARHDETHAIAVYAEDFGDGRALARAAAAADKPVVLLSAGRGTASARSARSHTGALTTSADVVAAACRDAGVELVATPREMAVVLAALGSRTKARGTARGTGRRTAVFTDGGGHGAIAADAAEARGLTVPELSAPVRESLRRVLWAQSSVANPVDLAGMGEQDPDSYARTVAALLDADEVDAVLMTGYFGGYAASQGGLGGGTAARTGPGAPQAPAGPATPLAPDAPAPGTLAAGELAAARTLAARLATPCAAPGDGAARVPAAAPKPLVVQSMYPDSPSCRVLARAGVPVFEATEDAARALAAMTAPRPATAIAPLPDPAVPLGDPGYHGVRALLAAAGVPFPAAREVIDEAGLLAAADAFPGPYVLKALHLLHKSDAGGVALRLPDRTALLEAHRAMHARLGAAAYSVEAMADLTDGVELIVGVNRDPRFGPVAMVGLGGVFTEALHDVAFALAPVPAAHAERLLRGLRTAALLTGARGRPPVDLRAAAEAVALITEVAAAHPEISELEVNPLLARPDGVLALDARAVLAPPPAAP
ncbi:acetate--CoA ligase family protein [Streptomyces sp. NRRL S-87]|uniref:acetate--CoA ligase family protein n=1 Tax=Streptomyces sp. NRRL S-87 TaxID=1463920 RepID=UPI0004BF1644|nr:acetate--CoA ligase [Streptomyces sp. NRRL S-87]